MWPRRDRHARAQSAESDPTSLGRILIARGYVTPEIVQSAVRKQLVATPPLGEILIEMGAITEDQLEDALYEQRKARGETSCQEDVKYQLTQQTKVMQHITHGLSEVAGLANAMAMKLKAK